MAAWVGVVVLAGCVRASQASAANTHTVLLPPPQVTTLSVLGRPHTTTFHLAESRAADSIHPLTSFEARGRHYYVDADYFENKGLLARLAPVAAAAHAVEGAEAHLAASEAQRQQREEQQRQQQEQHPSSSH